jgi:spermidine synthase
MPKIEISEERGVRFLHFGSPWIQGAMRIARPYALELEYTRDLMLPLVLHEPEWPATVLQVGLGTGSVTKFLYRHRPAARVTVVEISEQVIMAAYQYFRLPEPSERLRVELADGHDFLAQSSRKFDFIVVDGYDEKGRAGMLETLPFYVNCRARLSRRGMLAVNLITRTRGVRPGTDRLRQAFEDRVFVLPPSEAGNIVVVAASGQPVGDSWEALRASATALRAASGLNLLPALSRAQLAARGESGLRL